MLDELQQATLVAIDRLTRDNYIPTDSSAIIDELARLGQAPTNSLIYTRLFMRLKEEGYLTQSTTILTNGADNVELTGHGLEQARANADPFQEVYSQARRSIASEGFAAAYPGAFQAWEDAERLLFSEEVESQLTTIGHQTWVAMQAFANALIEVHQPPNVETNKALVEKRLGAVIDMYRGELGADRRTLLENLGDLWETTNKLVQRQRHGAEKEGEPVSWDDARRIVYLTMFLMIEFVTILEERKQPPPATLEPAG